MYKSKKIILTICARGGSKGVVGKNIKPLFGKPLIVYTIRQAKSLPWVDRIILSTDDIEIKKIAQKEGLDVPFMRPWKLATDKSAKIPVIIHAVNYCRNFYKEEYDIICDLDPTSPLRKISDINSVVDILINTKNTKAVFSVCDSHKNPYFNMVELNGLGYATISKKIKSQITRRQDAPKVYEMNASIYGIWQKVLLREKTFFTNATRIYLMPRERSVDIDSAVDFKLVEILMRENKVKSREK